MSRKKVRDALEKIRSRPQIAKKESSGVEQAYNHPMSPFLKSKKKPFELKAEMPN
jgi:hypothetical protein